VRTSFFIKRNSEILKIKRSELEKEKTPATSPSKFFWIEKNVSKFFFLVILRSSSLLLIFLRFFKNSSETLSSIYESFQTRFVFLARSKSILGMGNYSKEAGKGEKEVRFKRSVNQN